MKAERVRLSSQAGALPEKIAHTRDRRDSRWDEHRRARREQLVQATLTAVGKHGAGVGMEEIAAEAGTSKTVVYRHFADRSELHVAVCNRVASQLLPKLRAAIERGGTSRPAPSTPIWRSSRPIPSCTASSSISRPSNVPPPIR